MSKSRYNPFATPTEKEVTLMPRFRFLLLLGISAAMMAAQGSAKVLFAQDGSESKYEVLNPWAEVDPIPLRGISPRLDNLAGKKIGLFVNYKRAARPIALSVERRLKTMYPGSEPQFFYSLQWNVSEIETNRDKFASWIKGVDAVIFSVGD
jgi:hypothetical protein